MPKLQSGTNTKDVTIGLLFGFETADNRGAYILGYYQFSDPTGSQLDEEFDKATNILPGGMNIVGVFFKTTESNLLSIMKQVLSSSGLRECFEDDRLLVLRIDNLSSNLVFHWYNFLDLEPAQMIIYEECSSSSDHSAPSFVTYRIRATLSLGFQHHTDKDERRQSIESEIYRLKDIVQSEAAIFHVAGADLLLYNIERADWPNRTDTLSMDAPASELADLVCEDRNKTESGTAKKKTKSADSNPLIVNVSLMVQSTGTNASKNSIACVPIIHYNRESFKFVRVCLDVDVLAISALTTPLHSLPSLFVDSICRQLGAIYQCLVNYSKGDTYPNPRSFHFAPDGLDHTITLVIPDGLSEEELEPMRKKIHQQFMLVTDRPMFRRQNALMLDNNTRTINYLQDVHVGLGSSGVVGGIQYNVRGHYEYRHYSQDRMDDNGWGCAYRSLQTLVSWFRLQGYTEKMVPTHTEIQQALVAVGDKEVSFVGSRKWIGSTEVSYVLDHSYNIVSKILHVSSGAEMSTKARELARHFELQGTPIMIGGGVFAHTILGVDWNEDSGVVKFLVLDPHYTGAEDLKIIQDKGWCGWKGTDFWDQHAYYNMCMPQRPVIY